MKVMKKKFIELEIGDTILVKLSVGWVSGQTFIHNRELTISNPVTKTEQIAMLTIINSDGRTEIETIEHGTCWPWIINDDYEII